jgi:transposase
VKRCQQPGVSLAALALAHGVNANLLRTWVTHWGSRDGDGNARVPRFADQRISHD